MVDRGIVYLAVNHTSYLEAALISAIALRDREATLPITVFSNLPELDGLCLDRYGIDRRRIDLPASTPSLGLSRRLKTQLNTYSPYGETLFLDADILPIGDLTDLWAYLDGADMAMAADRMAEIGRCDHVAPEEINFTLAQLAPETRHFNSGVVLWRRTVAIDDLFTAWQHEWQRFGQQDQLALARAIDLTQTSVVQLPYSYNISPRDAEPLIKRGEPIHLLHCWGGKVTSGRFKKLARRYCPQAVGAVDDLWAKPLATEPVMV